MMMMSVDNDNDKNLNHMHWLRPTDSDNFHKDTNDAGNMLELADDAPYRR